MLKNSPAFYELHKLELLLVYYCLPKLYKSHEKIPNMASKFQYFIEFCLKMFEFFTVLETLPHKPHNFISESNNLTLSSDPLAGKSYLHNIQYSEYINFVQYSVGLFPSYVVRNSFFLCNIQYKKDYRDLRLLH